MTILEVGDERSDLAQQATALLERTFDARDRHSAEEFRMELAEKRLGLIAPFGYHLLVGTEGDVVTAAATGTYLEGVNAGFVAYLAVAQRNRAQGVGRLLRPALIERFRADAAAAGHGDLFWVLGEVSRTNRWLRRLVRSRGAIPFDLDYFHPGMRPPPPPSKPYILYRQPITDPRVELPADLVRRILYAIYRRAYRVRYPLLHAGFAAMIEQLQDRATVGAHPDFDYPVDP